MRRRLLVGSLLGAGLFVTGCGDRIELHLDPNRPEGQPGAATAQPYAFLQGNIVLTERPLDLAINGRGFFIFRDETGQEVYSRNGALRLDHRGQLVNTRNLPLLAHRWDETLGRNMGELVPVQVRVADGGHPVATGQGPVVADRGVVLSMNLDAESPVIPDAVPRINFDDKTTYNFKTTLTVYDALGLTLQMDLYFQKIAVNQWRIFATINDQPLEQPVGVPYDPLVDDPDPAMLLTFDHNGRLVPGTPDRTVVRVVDPRVPPAAPVLYEALPLRVGYIRQVGADFEISELRQDGFPWGHLGGVRVDGQGFVIAYYSNGQERRLYRLHLAEFDDPSGLYYAGQDIWWARAEAGRRVVNPAGEGSAGVVQPGALEQLTSPR